MLENDINSYTENTRKMVGNITSCFNKFYWFDCYKFIATVMYLQTIYNLVNNLGARFLRPIASSSRENYGLGVL